MKEKLNELHLFAGAGGGILGGILLGHTTVCAVEIEPYCREVLLQRQRDGILPKFPIWDDVCTFDGTPWRGKVDVVCGGFPCQDISVAGRGAGIQGNKSGLWREMARIIAEIRPRYAFLENSPILTSRGLGVVLGDLAEMGYDAEWCVLGAHHLQGKHKRDRIWILADSASKRCEGHRAIRQQIMEKPCHEEESPSGVCENRWQYWQTEPKLDRLVDGMAHRVDRLKAIGNGQVASVAATAWRILGGE
jgi:DNA (cytosine-5)-methyltransferase 1